MNEMIEKLLSLQRLHMEMDRIRGEAQIYPDQLESARADEAARKKEFEQTNARLTALEAERQDAEAALKLEEQRLQKSQAKLKLLKTHYEYSAMQREIDGTKRSNAELEETVLKKMEEIEGLRKAVAELEAAWKQSSSALEIVESEAATKMSEYGGVLAAKQAELDAAAATIDRNLMSKYRLIRERRHRNALVPTANYACQGCFMSIPPQQINEMKQQQTISVCPNCSRLLYVSDDTPGAA